MKFKINCAIFLIIITLLFVFTCYFTSSDFIDKRKCSKETIGKYIINFDISLVEYTNKELAFYKDVTLELNDNYSFKFSIPFPEGYGCCGKWEVGGSKIERNILLKYKNGRKLQIGICSSREDCVIDVRIPIYEENIQIGSKNIFFTRISGFNNYKNIKYK